jgi:hypothetical protein
MNIYVWWVYYSQFESGEGKLTFESGEGILTSESGEEILTI